MILGIDLGRKRHYTVIIGVAEIEDKIIVKLIKSLQNTRFEEQIETIKTFVKLYETTKIVIDAGGIGMPISEELREKIGPSIQPITFTNESKQQMMVNLRMLFEQKKIVLPKHAQLINSLHKIQRKKTNTGLEQFEAKEDETGEHGDFAWALAMACYTQKQSPGLFAYGIKKK